MRLVIYGAGAVGGVIAAHLHEAGHDTVVIARGAHLRAVQDDGLTLATRDARRTIRIPAVGRISELKRHDDDVVLLTTKSQGTPTAIEQVAAWTSDVPIVCMQNGVANERTALRRFPSVLGGVVMLPATFVHPGVVAAQSAPTAGILDIGRWPGGGGHLAEELSERLRSAGFASRVVDDVARWKYRKLITNLSNVVDALCGPAARNGTVSDLARDEGRACLDVAGIDYVSDMEDAHRRTGILDVGEAIGQPRQGSSTWQSLARGVGNVETDYLNGEVVLLGRLHGFATPVNNVLQRLAREHVRSSAPPGSMDTEDLLHHARQAMPT